ncbi:MAG: DUF4129 domain-containing protein [Synechococcales bacterium]|nr:DUF4129 domain-containing protein [Synechococcales bacterium]
MTTESFQTSSVSWQLQQISQRVGEWIEYQLYRIQPPDQAPDLESPVWFIRLILSLIAAGMIAWMLWQLYLLARPYLLDMQLNRLAAGIPITPGRPLSPTELWQRANQLQHQGNYREACRMLYLAMIQQLSDRQLITLDESRTDGEYLQLVQHFPAPQPYQVLIEAHQQLCFGDLPATAELFNRCRQAYREILSP